MARLHIRSVVTRCGRRAAGPWLLLFAMAATTFGQYQGGRYEPVPVSNVSVNEAAAQVSKAFGNDVDVVADAPRGRLLISGPQQAVASAKQLVQRIDQPLSQQPHYQQPNHQIGVQQPHVQQPINGSSYDSGYGVATPAVSRAVVSYRVVPNDLERVASMVAQAFEQNTAVTVATDRRLSQLLVVAPAQLQSQVQGLMARQGYSPEMTAATERRPAFQDRSPVVETYTFQHVTWNVFADALVRAWGQKLTVESGNNEATLTVHVPVREGLVSVVEIDRNTNQLTFRGDRATITSWKKAIQTIDIPADQSRGQATLWIAVEDSNAEEIRKVVSYLQLASATRIGKQQQPANQDVSQNGWANAARFASTRSNGQEEFPQGQDGDFGNQEETLRIPLGDQEGVDDVTQAMQDETGQLQSLIGQVRISFDDQLNSILIQGHPRDVERVRQVIAEIVGIAEQTLPQVEVYPLEHADSQAIATVVQELYDQVYSPRQGTVSITALLKPNSLLIVGRDESVNRVVDLIQRLDVPVEPSTEFTVRRMKHMSAVDAKSRIDQHFSGIEPQGFGGSQNQFTDDIRVELATRVRVTADYRSNSVIISAGPRDMQEVLSLLDQLDVVEESGGPVNTVEFFPLKNALAEELAPVLQDVLNGQLQGPGVGYNPGGTASNLGTQFGNTQQQLAQIRSAMLELVTIDSAGQRRITKSGINFDVRVTADVNSNQLIVQGPAENMDLIGALVDQLDKLPNAETQIKVYTIVNGDAAKLLELLRSLFGSDTQGGGGGNVQTAVNVPLQSGTIGDSSTLVALRFAIDTRTNSLIVSGSEADLEVVESILIRLDLEEFEDRVISVTRLSNSYAPDVATAIQNWLSGRNELNDNEDLFSIYQIYERTIIVVADEGSNSLIVSASRKVMPEIEAVINSLDRRPPMVLIKVLLAQVQLGDFEEFGFEMGFQDSLLFDRGASNIGFPFNQSNIGNDPASYAATREPLLAQGLSNLNVGRTNSTLGYGGLVLSAGNESVNLLLRALKDQNRLQILSSPQIMTLENLQGFVQVGQQVPYVTESNITNVGIQNTITFVDAGVLLAVTPRVSPDGMMALEVDATKSAVGSEADGVPISVTESGDVVRAPRIDIITAQTTLLARSGQTIVMGGLIEKTNEDIRRGVPILSTIPGVGGLFRYEASRERRDELLIILTPYLVDDEEDIAMINQTEFDRMNWCMADIATVYGSIGYGDFESYLQCNQPVTIYPDEDPTGETMYESEQLMQPLEGEQFNPQPTEKPMSWESNLNDGAMLNAPIGTSQTSINDDERLLPKFDAQAYLRRQAIERAQNSSSRVNHAGGQGAVNGPIQPTGMQTGYYNGAGQYPQGGVRQVSYGSRVGNQGQMPAQQTARSAEQSRAWQMSPNGPGRMPEAPLYNGSLQPEFQQNQYR